MAMLMKSGITNLSVILHNKKKNISQKFLFVKI